MQLNLSQKIFILVAVPLAFEITFFTTLAVLLKEAERQAALEQHSMNVVAEVNSLQRLFINNARSLASYAIAKKMGIPPQHFGIGEVKDGSLQRLKSLTSADPQQREAVARIEVIFNDVEQVIEESKRSIDDGIYEGGLLHARLLHQELNSVGVEFQQVTRQIVAREKRKSANLPRTSAQTKKAVDYLLQSGLVLSIIIALGLTVYFNKGTTRRLARLMENTDRVAQGMPLNPALSGADEIARLDKSFHQMAETIEAAMKKERAVIENMPVGVVIINNGGMVSIVNPKTEQLFECDPRNVVGQPFCNFFGEGKDPVQFMNTLKERALHRVIEMRGIKKNGDSFPVDLSLSQFGDASEELWLVSVSDASDRHRVERMKGELVSIVCHDLRTPLTSVQTNMWLLSEGAFGELSSEARRIADVSEREVDRLINLVKDWLDVQVIESGQLALHCRAIHILAVIEQSIDAVLPLAAKSNIRVEATDCGHEVVADHERLTQVMVNLLSNAIQYSPQGSKILIHGAAEQRMCRIHVTDTGPGIPHEQQIAIFNRFQRGAGDHEHNKRGAGLGLAIAKEIVERHGGTIGVTSEPGAGSTFWFDIPLVDEGQ